MAIAQATADGVERRRAIVAGEASAQDSAPGAEIKEAEHQVKVVQVSEVGSAMDTLEAARWCERHRRVSKGEMSLEEWQEWADRPHWKVPTKCALNRRRPATGRSRVAASLARGAILGGRAFSSPATADRR